MKLRLWFVVCLFVFAACLAMSMGDGECPQVDVSDVSLDKLEGDGPEISVPVSQLERSGVLTHHVVTSTPPLTKMTGPIHEQQTKDPGNSNFIHTRESPVLTESNPSCPKPFVSGKSVHDNLIALSSIPIADDICIITSHPGLLSVGPVTCSRNVAAMKVVRVWSAVCVLLMMSAGTEEAPTEWAEIVALPIGNRKDGTVIYGLFLINSVITILAVPPITFDSIPIPPVSCVRYLGLYIDKRVTCVMFGLLRLALGLLLMSLMMTAMVRGLVGELPKDPPGLPGPRPSGGRQPTRRHHQHGEPRF
ncbi:hypothetical protein AAG570_009044 [Ranatra chinensis]|uniref:Uncharacterized protein n=1 Tax=Ranatra chinensis TaxID=642074 RepID=A0ABD0ZDU6_9HEMI